MEDLPFLLEIYWVLQWPWCCRLQVQELTQRHRQQQTGWCRRRTPEIKCTAKMCERDCEKKLHLLWKPESTSRCEYYKAFISCSFIVFSPICGERVPSTGHYVNSLSISNTRRLFPQWHVTLQQSCSENCRQDGAGINLKVRPGKQSRELIQTHHLDPSTRIEPSIQCLVLLRILKAVFVWCVNDIIIVIKCLPFTWKWTQSKLFILNTKGYFSSKS